MSSALTQNVICETPCTIISVRVMRRGRSQPSHPQHCSTQLSTHCREFYNQIIISVRTHIITANRERLC